MDTKTRSVFLLIQGTHLNINNRHHFRKKGWKKILQENGPKEQAGVAIFIADKKDFKPKLIRRDNEEHYILKGKIHQENIAILNIQPKDTQFQKKHHYSLNHILTLTYTDRGRRKYSSLANRQIIQTKTEQRNAEAKRYYKPNRPNRHLQNISPKHKRIHMLLCSSWNFLQNGLHIWTQASLNRKLK